MKFTEITHDEMLERLRLCECALSAAVKERDGLREQLEGWKRVAHEAEKVRDLALEAKAAAELARVKAEQERDAIRIVANGAISKLCDASFALHTGSQWDDELQSCHGGLSDYLIDRHNSARHALGYLRTVMQKIEQKPKVVQDEQAAQEAEQERDQAHERAANLAVELAAMTLSRDQARQEADTLRRQVDVLANEFSRHAYCDSCNGNAMRICSGTNAGITCASGIKEWALEQAKGGGK